MRITDSHEIHPVMKAINHPEHRPLMMEPMNALSIVLKAAADGESSHDIVASCDFCARPMLRNDSVVVLSICIRGRRHYVPSIL